MDDLVERWKREKDILRSAQSLVDLQSQGPTHPQNQQEKPFEIQKRKDLARGMKRVNPVLVETSWPSTGNFVYSEPSLKRMKMTWDLNGDALFKDNGTACNTLFLL